MEVFDDEVIELLVEMDSEPCGKLTKFCVAVEMVSINQTIYHIR